VCTQNWLRSKPINGYDTEIVEDLESYKLESGKLLAFYYSLLNLFFYLNILNFYLSVPIFVEINLKNINILLEED
jgi:hypothetical protein